MTPLCILNRYEEMTACSHFDAKYCEIELAWIVTAFREIILYAAIQVSQSHVFSRNVHYDHMWTGSFYGLETMKSDGLQSLTQRNFWIRDVGNGSMSASRNQAVQQSVGIVPTLSASK